MESPTSKWRENKKGMEWCSGSLSTTNTIATEQRMRCLPQIQKQIWCTMRGPLSSYCSFEIHISWKDDNDERMLPPIQTEYFLSGGATTFTLMEAGANLLISLVSLWSMLGNMVLPPESTALEYRSRRISTSHLKMESYVNLWIPSLSLPIKLGLNRTSGHRNLSAPTVMICPSGSS